MTTPPNDRILPKKENDLFRSLVKCYEEKQYKKGIKNADSILKKYPNHGETLAMKGLVLNSMGKKEESYEFVKLGLKNDVRSHVCWHVFGLLYRSDRNYKEAIKCYLNALRIDRDNFNILRDLSFLQVQMRDMSGFAETRRKLLTMKPTNKINWISYAVSLYCSENYQTAFEVVDKFLTTSLEERVPYEQSELYLFQNRCLEASRKYSEALEHLETSKSFIVDLLSWKIKKGELFIKTGQFSDALDLWSQLLREQPDNYRFHTGYQISLLQLPTPLAIEMLSLQRLELPSNVLALSAEQYDTLRQAYQSPAFKSSISATRILLSLHPLDTHEQQFLELLSRYIQRGLRKGIPNLYNDICALIRVPDSIQPSTPASSTTRLIYAKDAQDYQAHPITQLTLQLLDKYIESLSTNGTFELSPADDAVTEVPTTLLWCYYLRSHIRSVCGRHEEALKDIEASIDHTPTSLDSLAKRARILKNCGDYIGACEQMNYCRSLDLQDRSPLLFPSSSCSSLSLTLPPCALLDM
jgi:N-alpha-acetyltransferase 15/16, NatA auxiliary subunit